MCVCVCVYQKIYLNFVYYRPVSGSHIVGLYPFRESLLFTSHNNLRIMTQNKLELAAEVYLIVSGRMIYKLSYVLL